MYNLCISCKGLQVTVIIYKLTSSSYMSLYSNTIYKYVLYIYIYISVYIVCDNIYILYIYIYIYIYI